MNKVKESTCKAGVFQKIFEEYSPIVHNYLYYHSGNREQAEDWVQEAFLKLWRNCAKVPANKAKGWVFMVAKNLFKNQLAHKKVVLKFQEQALKTEKTTRDPLSVLEGKETMSKIEHMLSTLPDQQRTVLLMSRLDGLSYKQIAAIEGVGVKAIEKRIHKALIALRKLQ